MTDYPSQYWHCYVKLQGNKKYAVHNDLSFEQIQSQILSPWHQSSPFTVSGKILTKDSQIEEIKVTQTDEPQRVWADRHNDRQRANNVCDMATDRCMLPIRHGRDMTFELLFAGKKEAAPDADASLIEKICKRVPNAARILRNRQRKDKAPYVVEDEYDVQDLLHAILRAYLKHSVQEDPLPKVAGTKSSRADISIEELGILIEVKFVHGPDDQKRIFDEFSQDLVVYTSWTPLKTLLFVIYNADDLRDPEALEKLSGPKKINNIEFNVRVILA
jgi:hypothetical protein